MSNFDEYRISKVIAIDDAFNIIYSEETEINNIPPEIRSDISMFHLEKTGEGNIDAGDEDTTMRSFFNSFEIQTLGQYFRFADLEKKEIEEYLQIMNSSEKNHYETLLEDKTFEFKGWGADSEEKLLKNIETLGCEEDKTLIILDKTLALGDEKPEKILSIVLKAINDQLIINKNLFLVLFSTAPEDLKDYKSVVDYLSDGEGLNLEKDVANNLALHINFVNKSNYEKDHFISSLRKSQKANYVNSFDDIYSQCIVSLKERIWDMSHNEALLNYDYLMEGQHVDNIIYDMFTNKFSYTYNEFRNVNYDKIINPIRNSMQKYENFRDDGDILACYISDRFRFLKEINYHVNSQGPELKSSRSDDISYGDIIEIDKEKYVVISQNCDITIRNNGDRRLDSFNLIKIRESEEIIDANWLIKFYKKFLDSITYSETKNLSKAEKKLVKDERRKVFYGVFSEEIQKLGFETEFLEKIEEANRSEKKAGSSLDGLKFDNAIEKNRKKEYEIESYQIYTVPCFWLDVLLLRKSEDNASIVTKKSIQSSKEIRLATKRYIENQFNEMIEKFNEVSKEVLELSLETSMFNPIIPVKPVWKDDCDELIGFELKNVNRDYCLTQYEAKRLHKKILDVQTREALNVEIPI
ncbi:hypothetical protein JNUCC83_09860 [Vagococcus sp. JNUCC 83]